MSHLKIKVCGMTDLHQVAQLAAMGVDYAGFIFYEKSPRFVADKINSGELKSFTGIKKIGVFVNESKDRILQLADEYGLDAVQLHGDESADFCKDLFHEITVIKAFRVKGDEDLQAVINPYQNSVHYFLFDTKAKDYGGTGQKFDWSVIEGTEISMPYFLSGGIGVQDIVGVKKFAEANNVFAVDVNSKFELDPGVKNMKDINFFVEQLKQK